MGRLALAARLVLAAVLAWSGVAKAADPTTTTVAVRAYSLFPDSWVSPVATVLPFVEIALALLLVLGLAIRLSGVLSAVLLAGFIIGVISAAARGLTIDCGCFGGGGQVADGQTQYLSEILRDLGLIVLAGLLIYWPRSPLSIDALVARSQGRQA